MIEYWRGIDKPEFVGPRVFVGDCPNILTPEHSYKYLNLPVHSTERVSVYDKGAAIKVTRRIIRPRWWAGINGCDEGFVVSVRDDGTIHSISTVYEQKKVVYNRNGVCVEKWDDRVVVYDRAEQQRGILTFFGTIVLIFVLIAVCGS